MSTASRTALAALSTTAIIAASVAPATHARPAATKPGAKPAKVTAKHRAEIRRFRRQFQPTRQAGTIVHFTAQHRVTGQEPWSIEGWVEQGGAERYRYVQEPTAPAVTDDAPVAQQIVWGRGGYWAVTDVMRTGDELRRVTNVGYSDPAQSYDTFVYGLQHIDDAQAAFGTALEGPVIAGSPTRAVAIALPPADPTVQQSMTATLDAATRKPMRLASQVSFPGLPNVIDDAFDFSLWQTLPRTADAGLLGGTIPLTASIQTTDR